MSVKSALFILIAFLGLQARAHWRYSANELVVKVYSCFKKGSESCMEGSGLLIHLDGGYGVITSEHVVLPSNEAPVYHKVVDWEGHEAEAKFMKASWERGLAVLQLQLSKSQRDSDWANHWGENTPNWSEFGQFGYGPADNRERFYYNWTYGFPAGSKKMRTLSDAKYEGLIDAGSVLRKVKTYRFSGIPAEYGMSGGPMFDQQGLTGILTHVRFGTELKTYVIPAQEIYNFMDGREADFITRDLEDFKKQFFSKTKSEIVHHDSSQLRIERRDDLCLVVANGAIGRLDGIGSYFPGLLSVTRQMEDQAIRVARIKEVGGTACSKDMTLAQLVSWLAVSSSVSIEDYEGTLAADEDQKLGLTATPSFTSSRRQTVRYSLQGRQGKDKMMTNEIGQLYMGVEYTDRTGSQTVDWWDFDSRNAQIVTRWNDEYNDSQDFEHQKEAVSTDWYRELLKDCGKKGGAIEVIQTKIGKFKSCRIVTNSGTTWYGPVPILGILGWTSPSGNYSMRIEEAFYDRGGW